MAMYRDYINVGKTPKKAYFDPLITFLAKYIKNPLLFLNIFKNEISYHPLVLTYDAICPQKLRNYHHSRSFNLK